ncbi:MAG TPA: trypsin-like peptidase domain-containing protein [Chloroflexia bacterium]
MSSTSEFTSRPGAAIRRAFVPALVLAALIAAPGCTLSNLRPEAGATPTAAAVVTPTAPAQAATPTPNAIPTATTGAPATPTTGSAFATPTTGSGVTTPTTGTGTPTPSGSSAPATATTGTSPLTGIPSAAEMFERVVDAVGPAVVTVVNKLDPQQGFGGEASGSGVVIDAKGYIVTNNHVVANNSALQVIFSDGRTVNATLVGSDDISDLAVLKVDGTVPGVATLGDSSKLRPGQMVVAIGSALGDFQNTVTTGVISGLNRKLQRDNGIPMEDLIQTDAAINHGNSGGPLLDLQGEVIGINTAVVRASGQGDVAEGLGFSIPVNTVKTITSQLIAKGRVPRPYLGVNTRLVTPAMASYFGLRDESGRLLDHGVVVVSVTPGSPAEAVGLRVGDVVLDINGQQIDETNVLANILTHFAVNDKVTLTVVRNSQTIKVPVTLTERP